jgi:hypothetical protein
MEELDSLEVSFNGTVGPPSGINPFVANWLEFEYGARHWWTTAFYVDWQHTKHEGSLFTGWRFENRFRPFLEEHWINPVLYVEYEHLNGADKTMKEVVGFDGIEDFRVPNSEARQELEHELDTKLILSSEVKGFNIAENIIGEKNLRGGKWKFGYALGVSRPLATTLSKTHCLFCRERFIAGLEMYGGVGVWGNITLQGTSHYLAPVIAWTVSSETTLRFSPGWGLTDDSLNHIYRFSVSHEIDDFGRRLGKLFH